MPNINVIPSADNNQELVRLKRMLFVVVLVLTFLGLTPDQIKAQLEDYQENDNAAGFIIDLVQNPLYQSAVKLFPDGYYNSSIAIPYSVVDSSTGEIVQVDISSLVSRYLQSRDLTALSPQTLPSSAGEILVDLSTKDLLAFKLGLFVQLYGYDQPLDGLVFQVVPTREELLDSCMQIAIACVKNRDSMYLSTSSATNATFHELHHLLIYSVSMQGFLDNIINASLSNFSQFELAIDKYPNLQGSWLLGDGFGLIGIYLGSQNLINITMIEETLADLTHSISNRAADLNAEFIDQSDLYYNQDWLLFPNHTQIAGLILNQSSDVARQEVELMQELFMNNNYFAMGELLAKYLTGDYIHVVAREMGMISGAPQQSLIRSADYNYLHIATVQNFVDFVANNPQLTEQERKALDGLLWLALAANQAQSNVIMSQLHSLDPHDQIFEVPYLTNYADGSSYISIQHISLILQNTAGYTGENVDRFRAGFLSDRDLGQETRLANIIQVWQQQPIGVPTEFSSEADLVNQVLAAFTVGLDPRVDQYSLIHQNFLNYPHLTFTQNQQYELGVGRLVHLGSNGLIMGSENENWLYEIVDHIIFARGYESIENASKGIFVVPDRAQHKFVRLNFIQQRHFMDFESGISVYSIFSFINKDGEVENVRVNYTGADVGMRELMLDMAMSNNLNTPSVSAYRLDSEHNAVYAQILSDVSASMASGRHYDQMGRIMELINNSWNLESSAVTLRYLISDTTYSQIEAEVFAFNPAIVNFFVHNESDYPVQKDAQIILIWLAHLNQQKVYKRHVDLGYVGLGSFEEAYGDPLDLSVLYSTDGEARLRDYILHGEDGFWLGFDAEFDINLQGSWEVLFGEDE